MAQATAEQRVLAVLPELYAVTSAVEFPIRALAAMRRAVGGSKGDWTEVDLRSGHFRVVVDPEPPLLASLAPERRAHMHEHPVLRHVLATGGTESRTISDFLTATEFHRLPLHGEFFSHLGVEDQLTILVSASPSGALTGASIDRDRRSFGPEDRRTVEVLRPHLAVAHANAAQFTRLLAGKVGAPQPPNAAAERLTDRQLEVLSLVAAGHTNAQIALALEMSVGTVKKHLEHILRRLGLNTRTAAAAWFVTAGRPGEAMAWTASEPGMLVGSA